MSLNFDLTACKKRLGEDRYEELTTSLITGEGGKAKWHDVTNSLIWMTMSVGLGEITEANLDEWDYRLRVVEAVYGPTLRYGDGVAINLTRADVENHVGLKTNVSNEKRGNWVKRFMENAADTLMRQKREGSAFDKVQAFHLAHLAKQVSEKITT